MSGPSLPIAVMDANGIIGLAKGSAFALSRHLFHAVVVPPSVVAEVTDAVSRLALDAALADWL